MFAEGVGGIAATSKYVVIGSRDALDRHDLVQCFDATDGLLLWQHLYPARGRLDYGNSPRTTPLIQGDSVFTLGAFGDLCCLELETGLIVWQRNLTDDFEAPPLTWGNAVSPLLADGRLIVQPGGKKASLVALNPATGEVIWTSAGTDPSYSALVSMVVGGRPQIVGYDAESLGGWDVETGKRIWKLVPPVRGDFNVPTVVPVDGRLLVSSENNGTRLYQFHADGTLDPMPLAVNVDLAPDAHTPVICGDHVYGIWNDFYVLDLRTGLKTSGAVEDDAFCDYCSLIASDSKLLALTSRSELILLSADMMSAEVALPKIASPRIISRLQLGDGNQKTLSHPAIVGSAMYVRFGRTLARLDLQ